MESSKSTASREDQGCSSESMPCLPKEIKSSLYVKTLSIGDVLEVQLHFVDVITDRFWNNRKIFM